MKIVIQILISSVLAAAIVFWWIEMRGLDQGINISNTEEVENLEIINDQGDDEENQLDRFESLISFEEWLVDVIDAVSPSVVNIIANQDFEFLQRGNFGIQPRTWTRQLWGWSGFIVSRDGYIITNRHVVDDQRLRYSVVYEDGSATEIDEIRLDPSLDIAVIKVASNSLPEQALAIRAIALDESVSLGQFAFAIWNTLAEFQNSISFGIVAWRNRTIDIGMSNRYAWLYQTDASISQWNSGWPLFTIDGKVIGVNTAVSALWENIGFAIPITQEFIDATFESVRQYGEIRRPFIGIRYVDLDPQNAQEFDVEQTQWVLVQEVVSGSSADRSGIQSGDILVSVDWKMIDDEYPLQYQLFTKLPNESLTVKIIRDQQELEVVLRLWEQ